MLVTSFYEQYIAGLRTVLHLLEQALENRQPVPGGDNLLRLNLLFEEATASFDHVVRCMREYAQTGGPKLDGELAVRLDECRAKLLTLRARCADIHQARRNASAVE